MICIARSKFLKARRWINPIGSLWPNQMIMKRLSPIVDMPNSESRDSANFCRPSYLIWSIHRKVLDAKTTLFWIRVASQQSLIVRESLINCTVAISMHSQLPTLIKVGFHLLIEIFSLIIQITAVSSIFWIDIWIV